MTVFPSPTSVADMSCSDDDGSRNVTFAPTRKLLGLVSAISDGVSVLSEMPASLVTSHEEVNELLMETCVLYVNIAAALSTDWCAKGRIKG